MKTKLSKKSTEPVNDNSDVLQRHPDALIGRDREIKKLKDCLTRVTEGRGCFVILNGEAGIGKSTLMNYFAKQAQAVGFSIHSLGFRSIPIYDPYQPFMTLAGKMQESDGFSDSISSEDYSDFNIKNNSDNSDSLQILQDKYTYVRQYILTKIIKPVP